MEFGWPDDLGSFRAEVREFIQEVMTPELVAACQERDIRVMVLQSNNDPDAFRRILEWQVDMVNLNHADAFLAVQRAQADALTGIPFAPR